jgi:hypothetical protein
MVCGSASRFIRIAVRMMSCSILVTEGGANCLWKGLACDGPRADRWMDGGGGDSEGVGGWRAGVGRVLTAAGLAVDGGFGDEVDVYVGS